MGGNSRLANRWSTPPAGGLQPSDCAQLPRRAPRRAYPRARMLPTALVERISGERLFQNVTNRLFEKTVSGVGRVTVYLLQMTLNPRFHETPLMALRLDIIGVGGSMTMPQGHFKSTTPDSKATAILTLAINSKSI